MTVKPLYNYRQGARIKGGVEAQTAGEELDRIQQTYGYCTAEIVVAEAKDPEAPLHPAFTWDDEEAADLYRKHEARNIIRSVQVFLPDSTGPEPMLTRVVVEECKDGEPRGFSQYLYTRKVVSEPDLYQQARTVAREQVQKAAHALEMLERVARQQRHAETDRVTSARQKLQQAVESLG